MKINKIYEDLYEIKNFINDDELEEVFKIINSKTEEDWLRESEDIPGHWKGNMIFPNEKIMQTIYARAESLFDSLADLGGFTSISRYKKGGFIKEHSDQWIPDLDHYIGYGLVLYYNDDYQGGELYYPDLNIEIKPTPKSFFIHGGRIVHGSKPVISDDIRYFSTAFVKGTDEYPTILKKELFK